MRSADGRPSTVIATGACLVLAASFGCSSTPGERSAVRGCIRSTACGIKAYPRVSNCVDDLRHRPSAAMRAVLGDIYQCVNAARSCEQVERCYGVMGTCEREYAASCDGQVAAACDLIDKQIYRYDCGAVGATCRVDTAFGFDASCVGSPVPAAATTYDVDCSDGACTVGGSCDADALSACTASGELLVCLDGQTVSYRCAALGLGACEMQSNGWGRCSPP